MDIQTWLEDTADRAPPDHPDELQIPNFIQPHLAQPERSGRGYRRKRKRSSSNISYLQPQAELHADPDRMRHGRARSPALPSVADAVSERIETSHDSPEAPKVAPARTYEKRARHKTRPDRYEPKSRRRKERDTRKERTSGRERRKSRRKDDGGRTTGLVQSFQLYNGPKNSRLTVSLLLLFSPTAPCHD